MSGLTRRLIEILGKRAFVSFGLVTFLVAALLATVNITSRYAIKSYVDDQLARIHWDVAVYQTNGFRSAVELPAQIRSVEGVQRVETLAFLRARLPEGDVGMEVDGKPLGTPWLSILGATDLSLLPPQLNLALEHSGITNGEAANDQDQSTVLALVGPERAMGKAFLSLQGARKFSLKINLYRRQDSDESEQEPSAHQPRTVIAFSTPVRGVIRMGRDDLNRWLMDQTGSISYVPHIGVTLLMPYNQNVLERFESVSTGLVTPEMVGAQSHDMEHVQMGEYLPEVIHLSRLNRAQLISGWDIAGSLERVGKLRDRLEKVIESAGTKASVDSTTLVLLERMNGIARLIGLLSVLIALPLLWMAWVLAANLSGLLMLNERRKLGLMRLRGVPGHLLGRAFLLSISSGGFLGGVLGLAVGSVVSLLIYEKGSLPAGVLAQGAQLLLFLLYLVITLVLALLVSRRLVRYATRISPLEASGRVAASEATGTGMRFGWLQLLCLLLGAYTLSRWIFDFSIAPLSGLALVRFADRVLNFVGLPLFLYGLATLLVSHKSWIQKLLAPVVEPIGGRLGPLALKHIAVKPHRTVSFLLIVALMASVSLYPTITSRSFEDKAVRGAMVQMGTDLQINFNAPELVDARLGELKGRLGVQLAALRPEIQKITTALLKVEGVDSVTYLIETVLPNFYLPGHGLRGVPLYLLGNVDDYLKYAYSEAPLGISGAFRDIIGRLDQGQVAVSPTVADFWRISSGTPVLIGMDEERRVLSAPASGVVAFLSGTPPLTISDRQGYVQARLDYLNHLFNNNAYMVAAADSPPLANLSILIPRVVVLVKTREGTPLDSLQTTITRALPFRPLEVNTLDREIAKVGSDMFISLALQNMRIFLIGGLLLAVVAVLAVALANYVEDRRTLALLRIRGTSPNYIWRFIVATLFSPTLLGLILGALVALIAGYGLANYVWKLREIKTVVQLLTTHLVLSPLTLVITLILLALIVSVAWFFSLWVFRRTAREDILEG